MDLPLPPHPFPFRWFHDHGREPGRGLPSWQSFLGLALFGATIFVLGQVAVQLAPQGSNVAAWWPAAGASVGVVAAFYRSRWLLVAAIIVFSGLANFLGGRPVSVSAGFAVSNAAEAYVAAYVIHRMSRGRPILHGLLDIWRFSVAAFLGAITIGIGAGLTVALLTDGDGFRTFLSVVPSHAASVLLIVPFVLSTPSAARRRRVEVVANLALTVAAVLLVFGEGQTMPLAFSIMVPLMWAGLRLGVRNLAAQLVLVGVMVTLLTGQGNGPFAAGTGAEWSSNALVQSFIIVSALLLVPLAVAMSERERALARALASEVLFRRGFEEALVGMFLVRVEGSSLRVIEANQRAVAKLGVGVGEILPTHLRDDDFRPLGEIAEGLSSGEGWRGEMNFPATSGVRRYSVSFSNIRELDRGTLATCQLIDVTQRYHAELELELERQASRDHLTGLPNRVMFDQQLQQELRNAAESGQPLAVMFIDLDDFKLINDGFGHRAGDRILIEIARRIAAAIRPDDLVARMGGDEFAVVCPGTDTVEAARALAGRVQGIADETLVLDDLSYRVGLSIGVSLSRPDSTGEQLLSEADIALYAAKAAGKRAFHLYSNELGQVASARLRLESDLELACEQNEFSMYMQPVVEIGTGRIRAAEALIRWHHPDRGLVPPDAWLDVAERGGMMHKIGAWVLDESCRQASLWIPETDGVDAPAVHVNVSPRQLDVPGFADLVVETIERHQLAPHRLVLELTETYLAQIGDHLVAELDALAELGIRLAADDFGTGYSPLTRITDLPVRMIKIDKQFIDEITTDPRSLAIVTSLVDLADTLHFDVVAEGVETPTQATLLHDMGCSDAQGYLWSPAVPAADFCELLKTVPLRTAQDFGSDTSDRSAIALPPAGVRPITR